MFTQPFAIPALALFIVSLPLVVGVIPRNRYYGFRTRKTLTDEAAWYSVNRIAGVGVIFASAIYGGVALLWPYDRGATDNFSTWMIHLVGFVVPLIVALGLTARKAKQQ